MILKPCNMCLFSNPKQGFSFCIRFHNLKIPVLLKTPTDTYIWIELELALSQYCTTNYKLDIHNIHLTTVVTNLDQTLVHLDVLLLRPQTITTSKRARYLPQCDLFQARRPSIWATSRWTIKGLSKTTFSSSTLLYFKSIQPVTKIYRKSQVPQEECDFQMDWHEQLHLKFTPLCATFCLNLWEIFHIKVSSG